jgi:Cu/Ag efflux protein CusF
MTVSRMQAFGVALALLVCGVGHAAAQTKALPKGSASQSTKVTATVTALDQKNRVITLKTPDGLDYTFVVDPAVKNLPQVNVGDTVSATYTEALAYEVKKGGTAAATETIAGGTAEPGKKPAAALGRQVTLTVSIAAIDPAVPSVTFKGPQGNTRTIKVRDPKKLEGVSVGDTVQITYTEALALKIEKADAKK